MFTILLNNGIIIYNNMISKIKQFLVSRSMIRFYRVTGYGILSVILVGLLNLVPQIVLSGQLAGGIILILTAILNAVDKKIRDLKANK